MKMESKMTVTEMLQDLIDGGHVVPSESQMEHELPGAFENVRTITSYGIPEKTVIREVSTDAELDKRSSRDRNRTSQNCTIFV
jgi:hypothetical protein